jgi:hypothetical protein
MNKHGLCCVECHAAGTAQGELAGTLVERDRILKWVEATTDWDDFGEFIVYKDELLAVIKGEQQ